MANSLPAELKGYNYCFHIQDDGRLCGRVNRWEGHHLTASPGYHPYVKLGTVFEDLEAARWTRDQIAKHAIRLEKRLAELERNDGK